MGRLTSSAVRKLHFIFKRKISRNPELKAVENRKLYFLAACLLFDPDIDVLVALKLRPYGGLIGMDNSKLDSFLKFSKVFRLHAVLHDAAGFVKDFHDKGPGYTYILPNNPIINNCLVGHISGLLFCFYLKFFYSQLFSCLDL